MFQNQFKKLVSMDFPWKALLITIFVAAITGCGLLNYVASELGGNISWTILSSTVFGVPEELSNMIEPVCENGASGWDGQFYYYMSNDILGLKDTALHIDAPSYRYQRIGLPLLARLLGWILGRRYVTVGIYLLANYLVLISASFLFAKYLDEKNHSVLWILPWALSVGVQITFRHELPDGAADAFMIIALLLLFSEKYIGYSIAITLASLCREANISIAAVIFVLGFFGFLRKDKKYNIKFATILAIPGIIFVLWYTYVTVHFGAFPFSQAINITDIFGKGFLEYFAKAIQNHYTYEIVGLPIYAISVMLALLLEGIRGYKNHIWYAFIPFTVLVGSFGSTVMSHYSGYLKGISSLYIYIPLMLLDSEALLPVEDYSLKGIKMFHIERIVVNIFMIVVLVSSLTSTLDHARNIISTKTSMPGNNENAVALTDFSSSISLNENKGSLWVDMPYADLFHAYQKYTVMRVRIKNESTQKWSFLPKIDGTNAVYASYQWFKVGDLNTVIMDGVRNSLKKDVLPGEETEIDMYIRFPEKPGQYILRLSLLQEGVAWFYTQNQGYQDLYYVIE